jgi:hypothetical protein
VYIYTRLAALCNQVLYRELRKEQKIKNRIEGTICALGDKLFFVRVCSSSLIV